MKNVPLLLGTIVITLVMIVGIAFFFSKSAVPTTEVTITDQALLLGETANVKGATESAQVTVVEFSDFQCPACKAALPLGEALIAQYADKVKFVYRHFPLENIHPNARFAAQFAEAAAKQGKFWEVHDLLFERQAEWAEIATKEDLLDVFLTYADELQIDKTQLQEKIESTPVMDRVARDTLDANKIGITATPTFFVNGKQVPAPQLMSAVESLVTSTTQPAQ
jgi:protein-disulfide isomerase